VARQTQNEEEKRTAKGGIAASADVNQGNSWSR